MARPDPNVVRVKVCICGGAGKGPGSIRVLPETQPGVVAFRLATDVDSTVIYVHLTRGQARRLGKRLLEVAEHRERRCLVCGCAESAACAAGCAWISKSIDVCTACAWGQNGKAKERKARKLCRAAGVDVDSAS